ncbi:MAG TPA: hypothetical protein VG347_03125 [Verrucomicrobiae bacterium]|nr:hypothetical protein [Verrucomicrobiae bacterium]
MKVIHWFVHWLGASHENAKSPKPLELPEVQNTAKPSAPPPAKPKSASFADDDSPPGYKIRWYQ